MLEFFFYEMPHSTAKDPAEVVLSGIRTNVQVSNTYPYRHSATYQLDARSQALIGKSEVIVTDVELLHDSEGEYQIETPSTEPAPPTPEPDTENDAQMFFDFTASPEPAPPTPPEPEDLTLEMSKGKNLGKALKEFCKQHDAEHVTIDKQGIRKVYVNSYNQPEPIDDAFMPMPKGIRATGKHSVTIIAEALYRILQTTMPPNPSEKSFRLTRRGNYDNCTPTRGQRKLMYGLGNEYLTIVANGKLEITASRGKFKASIPTIQPTETTETETE